MMYMSHLNWRNGDQFHIVKENDRKIMFGIEVRSFISIAFFLPLDYEAVFCSYFRWKGSAEAFVHIVWFIGEL